MEAIETEKDSNRQLLYWCVTLSCDLEKNGGVTEEGLRRILGGPKVKEWIFQTERGAGGYIHFQCWIRMATKTRISEARKLLPKGHWSPSRGAAAEAYCLKNDSRIAGPWMFPYRYMGEDLINQLYPWQEEIVRICAGPVDRRKIYWYWEANGNVGKSALCKYLVFHHKARLIGGKSADALFAAVEGYKVEKPVYVIDLPRGNKNKVPYEAIEQLKNGLGFSSKYEAKGFIAPPAHIVIFANFPPDRTKLSEDRWEVKDLNPDPILNEYIEEILAGL